VIIWRIKKIWLADDDPEPDLEPDWEPFGITRMAGGWYIWLKWKPL